MFRRSPFICNSSRSLSLLLILFFVCTAPSVSLEAQTQPPLHLPAILSNNMVLQSGRIDPIWGWDKPGQAVTVKIAGQTKNTTTDRAGKWSIKLDSLLSGGPYDMTVDGSSSITVKNILVGEVWLCSGQSNMAMTVGDSKDAAAETAAANDPQLRFFIVPNISSSQPEEDCGGQWVECTPSTAPGFSAAGYYFGSKLRKDLNVPVGMIGSYWGGTSIQVWMSREGLLSSPDFRPILDRLDQAIKTYPQEKIVYDQAMADYRAELKIDPDYKKDDTGWEALNHLDDGWKTMSLPQAWDDIGLHFDGSAWFKKTVEIPADWAGKKLRLHLDKIDDQDVTCVNGTRVGDGEEVNYIRNYEIPATLVQGTKLTIAVKVINLSGRGGFVGTPDEFYIGLDDNSAKPISLVGDWTYFISEKKAPYPIVPLADPHNSGAPASLYNGMISPLVGDTIRGVIWYQGESNAGEAYRYRELLPAMIKDWRSKWGIGDFPFLIEQLANFQNTNPEPSESAWAELREAQFMALQLPATGMAVAIDIGEGDNIHFKDKQDVGRRLALWALAQVYGKSDLVYSGPLYQSMNVENGKIRIKFFHTGSGLAVKNGGALQQFAIAGEDKKWVWADAQIDGQTVLVSSGKVPNPVAVRYAWADNPLGCNLINQEGLPSAPFRTDDWPGVTVNSP